MNTDPSLKLSLGGHIVAVEGPEAVDFALQESFRRFAADGEPQWTVRFGCPLEAIPASSTLLSSFVFEEINSRCNFSVRGDYYYYSMFSASGDKTLLVMRHRRGSSLVESTSVDEPDALRFSLWFAVGMLTTPSLLTFIHSSTVVHRGYAFLFLGESGTGKSTHSRLWLNNIPDTHLLNDDSPLIEVRPGSKRAVVHGSPWSGKTPCFVPRTFPIAAIVRLSQAPHNAIRRLSTPEAFAALQPSLPPALVQDDYYSDKIVDIISEMITVVPFFHLECLPDADAARVCYNAVFPHPHA